MTRTLTIFVALAALAVGGWILTNQNQSSVDPFGAAFAQDVADVDTSMIQDMVLGNPEAKVTVIEYASYTCPHCAAFHSGEFQNLKADYIDTGKIKFVFRDFYRNKPDLWAGIVARCGEGADVRFFGLVDLIFTKQREWTSAETPVAMVEQLRRFGKTAGLTDADLDVCLTDGKNAEALWAYNVKNGTADDVNSTPTFIINGEKYGNMAYDKWQETLDAALTE